MELIRRENSTEDARRFRLFATPQGQEVRGRSEELSDRLESLLLAPLPANEVADMNAKLAKILRWVESSDYTAQLAQMAAQDQTSGPS
jgi:DNA-binding MarR family transcriptional regulator